MSQSLANRGAGRPKSNQLQGEELREHVIGAASLVYSEHGYRDTSVAKIIESAGISRPLFYRLFKSCYEVIDIIVERANNALIDTTKQILATNTSLISMVSKGIDAYFEWCRNYGPVVGPIYREISDKESPAYHHRHRLVASMIEQVNQMLFEHNQPELPVVFLDGLICVIEHIGSNTFWPEEQPETIVEQNRAIVKRIVLASLVFDDKSGVVPAISLGNIQG
ncbi:hypothetical protein GCM10007876_31620 [Litoribrevibacter albus]|uniref:HTH tetR-type domain-containing protein n=1 Tax=Litoribrevibacter albus TaxID=1473156 RepID=A0AA37W8M9_9GAMM|nr:hypothetical protein GCM10007876_31620 [Litoribrevibacter albus]